MTRQQFDRRGWLKFSYDSGLANWVGEITPIAIALAADEELKSDWLRCGGTWFAGVNILPNDTCGALGRSGILRGQAVDFIDQNLATTGIDWDKAQISVCYPGYPKPWSQEPETNHRYRKFRDSAHVDGLLPEGPNRRRHLRQPHAFILGIPLIKTPPEAAPFVLWEGSHHYIRQAFGKALKGIDSTAWGDVDVTDIYQQARRDIWDNCRRIELHADPGECYLVHALALHGVAPWPDHVPGPSEGRMIAYFRPETRLDLCDWLKS